MSQYKIMKVVIDTNIFISGLLSSNGRSNQIIKQWLNGNIEVIISEPLITEIKNTLQYPKILKIIKWDSSQLSQYIELLYFFTTVVDITNITADKQLRDIDDVKILQTFIAGKADYLITGDKDLLVLAEQYSIISPVEFTTRYLANIA